MKFDFLNYFKILVANKMHDGEKTSFNFPFNKGNPGHWYTHKSKTFKKNKRKGI